MLAAVTEEPTATDAPDQDPSTGDPVDDVDLSEAPEHSHKKIREMLHTQSPMLDGSFGTIRATGHATVAPADALPIRTQSIRTDPLERQIIADRVNKMLKMKVIEPSHSAWDSSVVFVPKNNGKARFRVDY